MTTLPSFRSYLYAPANRARFMEKAFQVGADVVVLDLEDAVPMAEKAAARSIAGEVVRSRAGKQGAAVFVRINGVATGLTEEDIRAVVQPGLTAIRLPKSESAEMLKQVAGWIDEAEIANGVPAGTVAINCSIENAVGVFRAFEIATAHPRVQLLGFGVGDFIIDVGGQPSIDQLEMATIYARSHLVVVSRAAGIRPPVDTVWPFVDDLENLERFARQARALGFVGKAAIHPKQVEIINRVFTPTEAELSYARRVIETVAEAESRGAGSVLLGKGEMIDLANVRRARDMISLSERLGALGTQA